MQLTFIDGLKEFLEGDNGISLIATGIIMLLSWVLMYSWKIYAGRFVDHQVSKGREFVGICYDKVKMPITFAIFCLGLLLVILNPLLGLEGSLLSSFSNVLKVLILILVVWSAVKIVAAIDRMNNVGDLKVENRTRMTTTLLISKFLLYFLLVLLIFDLLGYSMRGLVALGSASAIVLGLSARPQIENAISFFVIRSNGKFALGDVISLPSHDIAGVVESMTLSSTFIRSLDTTRLAVPNGLFMTNVLINKAAMTNRMVELDLPIRIPQGSDTSLMVKTIKKMLHKDERIASNQMLLVNITDYISRSDSFNLHILCFLNSVTLDQYYNGREAILLSIVDYLKRIDVYLGPDYSMHAALESVENCQDINSSAEQNRRG